MTILSQEEKYWFQQAKSKWISFRDQNSRFFHQSTLARRRQNRILALLKDEDKWVYEDTTLTMLVVDFYRSLYAYGGPIVRGFATQYSFPSIKGEDKVALNLGMSSAETRQALFSMSNFKSPRPDGFYPLFFKSQWEVVGQLIHQFVIEIFNCPQRIREVNHTLISLIPKGDDSSQAREFRPIVLCNVIYEIVTKMISLCLRQVLLCLIDSHQSSCIQGRSMEDNILTLQEAIHTMA